MTTKDEADGKITDAALAELKSRLGKELRHLRRTAIVTDDSIERYAFAIGDTNPLWTDRKYAQRSPHGSLLAPPTIAYVLSGWDVGTGLPGVHGLFVRSRVEWNRPIKEGDRIDSVGRMHEVTERPSRFAGRAILQGVMISFSDQQGEEVCTAQHWNLRTERGEAKRRGTQIQRPTQTYTKERIQQIENETFREEMRGDLPRKWEEVQIGDKLPAVVKGPLSVTDMVGYMRGGFGGVSHGFFMYTHGTASAFRRRHPAAVLWNSHGIPDSPEAVHWDDTLAQASGLAAAYDIGPQRIGWMSQVVTNWMGDSGFLRMIDVNLKKIVPMGDTTWCRAEVISKERQQGRNEVMVALTATNQHNEVVANGLALVQL